MSNTTQAPLVHFIDHVVSSSHLKAITAEEAIGIREEKGIVWQTIEMLKELLQFRASMPLCARASACCGFM